MLDKFTKYIIDGAFDTSSEQYYDYPADNNDSYLMNTNYDCYSPSDDRCLHSYVEDIVGGDNFIDYCKYIFELLEKEGYYE